MKGLITLVALAMPLGAMAQTPPPPPGAMKPAPGPALALSLDLARATLAACRAQGHAVAVSVVDSAGKARVTLSDDGFGGNPATSVKKGAAAAIYSAPGSVLEQRETADPDFARTVAARSAEVNVHTGSVPIRKDGVVIGGIGVTGAPTHAGDEACATQALRMVAVP